MTPSRTDRPGRVLLVSAYELGHQPLAVAAPAGVLRARGHEVRILDLSVCRWDPDLARWADRVAFSVPMHTAARLVARVAAEVDRPVCCFGLYAPMCSDVADVVLAGETGDALVRWVEGDLDATGPVVRLGREAARPPAAPPARDLLPPLEQYAHLALGGAEHVVGHVDASHGCVHRCRHCPVPVVYDGRLRVVDAGTVLDDIESQVLSGARHIDFGDPDFLNGPHHSLRIVRSMHERFPDVTFDCTVKVEHILRHASIWPEMAELGCLFVVSAFEHTSPLVLERLDKGHTPDDMAEAVALLRAAGIQVRPSWLPFTPWTTVADVRDILDFTAAHDLVGNVDPVQYTIRLLIPKGSLLLDLDDVAAVIGPWDAERFTYPWCSADPAVDELQARLAAIAEEAAGVDEPAPATYNRMRVAAGLPEVAVDGGEGRARLTEPWFCCAEPTSVQYDAL